MSKLTFYGLRVLYTVFLLCIPDYSAHARAARSYQRMYGHQVQLKHDNKVEEERHKKERELRMEVSQLLQRLQYRQWEREQAEKKLEEEEKRAAHIKEQNVVASVEAQSPSIDRSSRSWAAALTAISASAQAACVGVILSNMGCGGLQKDICQLRQDVAQLREDLATESKAVMTTEDRYEVLRDLASIADANNDNIVRKLEDSIDMSQDYLKLLAQVQSYVGTLPVVTPSFFSLDSEINKYIIDLGSVPSTTSSKMEATLWGATLGLELLPFVGAALQKGYYKITGKIPPTPDYNIILKREGSFYGIKGYNAYKIDGWTRQPLKQVSLSQLQGGKFTYIQYDYGFTQKTSTWQKFTSKVSAVASSALVKCMTYVFQVAAIALCTWQLVDIIQKNAEAKSELTQQKNDISGYLEEVRTSKADMDIVVEQVESQVNNHSQNFMLLNDILLSSRTFSQVGTSAERQVLIDINSTVTEESNLRSNQEAMYNFLNTFYTDLKNAYDYLRKYDQVALDVKTDTSVSTIKHKLEALSIPISGELEIYQIIATAYPTLERYDGINLVCIRDGTIGTEAQLTAAKSESALPQNVVSQIISMAMGMAPVSVIINVVVMRYPEVTQPTDSQVLEVIAKSSFFTDQNTYADYMGTTHDLTAHRGTSCT